MKVYAVKNYGAIVKLGSHCCRMAEFSDHTRVAPFAPTCQIGMGWFRKPDYVGSNPIVGFYGAVA